MPPSNGSEYVKLERRLVLLSWLNRMFGYAGNKELLSDIRKAGEGYDAHGKSYIYHHLVGRGEQVKFPQDSLARYDENIKSYVTAINERRAEPVSLRYFQYLSLLYTEVVLDLKANHTGELLRMLNEFVVGRNSDHLPGEPIIPPYTPEDLSKLAFWMATGSGKTLIMHMNYLQFLRYNRDPLDNIILITPNEGLTEQHLMEMTASGIPCERFNIEESGLGFSDGNTVRVIEITKLVEEKRGGGLSVPVDAFEGNNLIFVDEGHKGSGGESWRKYRDALGKTGFTFEYSATFGQALSAASRDDLTTEYGKSIVFDYSYKYFHGDGYGKDFRILNLREETAEDKTNLLLTGNLLSFYEQHRCFFEQKTLLRPYGLEKPLWVFVGSSVNAVYSESKRKRSDVLTITRFLHWFLENKKDAVKAIRSIIQGKTGLVNAEGDDVFADRFEYIKASRLAEDELYRLILSGVFHAPAGGSLHLCDIRGKAGELGLKVGGSDTYFGLIYIGDTTAFKNLVSADSSGIIVQEDVLADSLFESINDPDTSINILIGAKKFMEGWNSWRVSNMGLLNIGRSEGSEIIQLFGRGVRLRGKKSCLKRSSFLDGAHPPFIKLLETLNIFAIRANYMAQFRDYLEREGIDVDGMVEIPLAIRPNHDFLNQGLYVPRVPKDRVFKDESYLVLAPLQSAKVSLDLSMKAFSMQSSSVGLKTSSLASGRDLPIPDESLSLINWEDVYLKLVEFKEEKGLTNLIIQPGVLRAILTTKPRIYKLIADESVVRPNSFSDVAVLQDTVLSILRKYIEKFYHVCQERWDSRVMTYGALSVKDPNFKDYTIRVPRSESDLARALVKLIEAGDRYYNSELNELKNIHFDRHLYQPLLIQRGDNVSCDPPGLQPSELQFVRDIREYARREASASLASKEIYLLRNLSRGHGIGFFENEGFYPDFILWIKESNKQRIVFIEPHGMMLEKSYWDSDKVSLHERLAVLSGELSKKGGIKNVSLDSFIISKTPYDTLRSFYGDEGWTVDTFAEKHILFFSDDVGYLKNIF